MTNIEQETLENFYSNVQYMYLDLFNECEECREDIGVSAIYKFLPLVYSINETIIDIDKYELQEYIKHITREHFIFEYFTSAIIINYLFFRNENKYASLLFSLNKSFDENCNAVININVDFDPEEHFKALLYHDINKDELYSDFPEYKI